MTHFLRKGEVSGSSVQQPIACVTCRLEKIGGKEVLRLVDTEDVIGILKVGSLVAPLPDRVSLLPAEDDVPIVAEHRFWVSTETIDPYHVVIDTDSP